MYIYSMYKKGKKESIKNVSKLLSLFAFSFLGWTFVYWTPISGGSGDFDFSFG